MKSSQNNENHKTSWCKKAVVEVIFLTWKGKEFQDFSYYTVCIQGRFSHLSWMEIQNTITEEKALGNLLVKLLRWLHNCHEERFTLKQSNQGNLKSAQYTQAPAPYLAFRRSLNSSELPSVQLIRPYVRPLYKAIYAFCHHFRCFWGVYSE